MTAAEVVRKAMCETDDNGWAGIVLKALQQAGYEIVPAGTQAALRPFADGYRKIQRMYSIPHGIGYHKAFTMQDLARAAELVPEATSSPPSSPGSRAT